jgi:hypothetical protein
MNSGFEELLSLFTANGVRYLVVGGHAVMLYVGLDRASQLGLAEKIEAGQDYFSATGGETKDAGWRKAAQRIG